MLLDLPAKPAPAMEIHGGEVPGMAPACTCIHMYCTYTHIYTCTYIHTYLQACPSSCCLPVCLPACQRGTLNTTPTDNPPISKVPDRRENHHGSSMACHVKLGSTNQPPPPCERQSGITLRAGTSSPHPLSSPPSPLPPHKHTPTTTLSLKTSSKASCVRQGDGERGEGGVGERTC